MFEEFPSLESAKKWAKANHRKLQSLIEVDFYDDKAQVWHATKWVEGLPAETLLIHEKQHVKADLFGKNVVFDTVFKTVRKRNLQEIWVHQLKILC